MPTTVIPSNYSYTYFIIQQWHWYVIDGRSSRIVTWLLMPCFPEASSGLFLLEMNVPEAECFGATLAPLQVVGILSTSHTINISTCILHRGDATRFRCEHPAITLAEQQRIRKSKRIHRAPKPVRYSSWLLYLLPRYVLVNIHVLLFFKKNEEQTLPSR